MADFVLIPGPMLPAAVMQPTAEALRKAGHGAQVPDVWASADRAPPWREWPQRVAAEVEGEGPFIVVGHSAASVVAATLEKMGNVTATIFIDGFIPPQDGAIKPSEGALLDLIRSLPNEDGLLPPWDEWWKTPTNRDTVGLTALEQQPELWGPVKEAMPRLPINWFDDVIRMPFWRKKPIGFIRTSKYFDFSAATAEKQGWPLVRLDGTHLHPLLAPEETAGAIVSILQAFMRADDKFDASCNSLSARTI